MSPAALKRALDPAYIGSPFAQPFQFFDGDVSTPMDLTGRSVVLFLDRQGLPDAHHEVTGVIQTDGRVLFSVADTSAWIKGDYSLEVRLDGASVVVGRIVVAKGAGANGSDIVGAAQPPTAPGVVIAGSGVVQVVSVAPSAASDPAGIILPPELKAALGGAETLADALLWLAQNGGTPSPILRELIGGVVISSVATGALSVAAAGQVLLSGAISSVSSTTGSLTVGSASTIALVGSAVSTSSLTGAMTVVTQIALAGTAAGSSAVAGSLTVEAGAAVPYQPTSTIVSSNNVFPTAAVSFTNGTTSRRPHVASAQGAITNIRCKDFGGILNPATMTLAADTVGVTGFSFKRYVEYPDGVFHQVLWNGSPTNTPADFATTKSDVVISSVTSLPLVIPAGALWWERTVKLNVGTGPCPTIILPGPSSTIGNGAGKTLSDLGNSGTIAADASVNHFGAACWIGDVASAVARSFVCATDSLGVGQGDTTSVGANRESGWVARAVGAKGPYLIIGAGGLYVSALRTALLGPSMTTFLSDIAYTDFVDESGLNDMSSASRTPAQVLADKQAIWNAFATGRRVWTTTLTARTNSSNGYADAAGQTAKTDGTFAQSYALSDTLRTKPSPLFGVIDAGDYDMTARNSGIHAGPFPPVTDGTHFLSPKCVDMAVKAQSALAAV